MILHFHPQKKNDIRFIKFGLRIAVSNNNFLLLITYYIYIYIYIYIFIYKKSDNSETV